MRWIDLNKKKATALSLQNLSTSVNDRNFFLGGEG